MPRRAALATTWLAVAAAAMALTWLAISSAIASTSERVLPARVGEAQLAAPRTTPAAAPTLESAPSTDAGAFVVPDGAPAASSAPVGAGAGGGGRAAGDAPPVAPAAADDSGGDRSGTEVGAVPPATAAPAPVTTSFTSQGGFVTVSCSGESISLVSASPQPGYRAEVKDSGPREVDVRFSSSSANSEVKAQCQGGQAYSTGGGDASSGSNDR